VQIAHNVQIGTHCIICAQAGISGSTRLGNGVVVGGQVGTVGHIEIGDAAQLGAKSGVSKMSHLGPFGLGILLWILRKLRNVWLVSLCYLSFSTRVKNLEQDARESAKSLRPPS
jgi:UDP-3-O-[3-hydroxymyristoyl] glucosamine N-acyltransferase